jgi:hypothetical protein
MSQPSPLPAPSFRPPLPRNVKVLGLASLFNDIASEMIFPLLPNFLLTVLLGNRFTLGVIEGAADSVASLLKLWSGGRSDRAGRRRGFVLFGYSLAAVILHFLQGEAALTLGGDKHEATVGTWVHMPAGMKHSIKAKTPVVMLLLLLK